MFNLGDRVEVIKDTCEDHTGSEVGRQGTVVAFYGGPGFNTFVALDGYVPTEIDEMYFSIYGTPRNALPFQDDELKLI